MKTKVNVKVKKLTPEKIDKFNRLLVEKAIKNRG